MGVDVKLLWDGGNKKQRQGDWWVSVWRTTKKQPESLSSTCPCTEVPLKPEAGGVEVYCVR